MTNDFDFSWMLGRCITGIHFDGSSQWRFSFEPELGIGIECPWRLLLDGRVAISNEDHLQRYGLQSPLDAVAAARSLLASHTVVKVDVRDGTADLLVAFTGGLRLEALAISSGYESWTVFGPSGSLVVAQGGGHLCVLQQ